MAVDHAKAEWGRASLWYSRHAVILRWASASDKNRSDALKRALARDASERTAREEALRRSERLAMLTPRERDIVARIVAGKLNKQIADDLGIGLRTVKAYQAQLMVKLGVDSASELGKLAGEMGDTSG